MVIIAAVALIDDPRRIPSQLVIDNDSYNPRR
jgi:hypothetical protein